ncbi:MAG: hypothetical protein ABGY21_13900 [Pseudomonadota bacterium]
MSLSAICARTNRISGIDEQGDGHLDWTKHLRYLDAENGDYVEDKCECACHVEKREWYLSDFGRARIGYCGSTTEKRTIELNACYFDIA